MERDEALYLAINALNRSRRSALTSASDGQRTKGEQAIYYEKADRLQDAIEKIKEIRHGPG